MVFSECGGMSDSRQEPTGAISKEINLGATSHRRMPRLQNPNQCVAELAPILVTRSRLGNQSLRFKRLEMPSYFVVYSVLLLRANPCRLERPQVLRLPVKWLRLASLAPVSPLE